MLVVAHNYGRGKAGASDPLQSRAEKARHITIELNKLFRL
jgi:hypothetical protein